MKARRYKFTRLILDLGFPVQHIPPVFAANVDILDAGCRGHDESLRCPGAVAALVEPGVVFYVQWELALNLSCVEITSTVYTALFLNPGDSGVPHEPIDDVDVIR